MHTLEKFTNSSVMVPSVTALYCSDIGEARGRQELYIRQSPQKLKSLREHAIIESAVSSNRIEGVTVDRSRVGTVVFGRSLLLDRDEEEVRGYRNALSLIHEKQRLMPVSEETIKRFHYISRSGAGDAGEYKVQESDIIEKYPDGRERIRFRTVPAADTPRHMEGLVSHWDRAMKESALPGIVVLAAWNLDFLCVHPFRDGNGRVSRLMLLLQLYHLGFEAGRYISLERIIEETKDRYYETLEQSSQGWHTKEHDPWPFINYLLYTIKSAYREFEDRLSQAPAPRGAKRQMVEQAIESFSGDFAITDILDKCPGVSIDTVRKVFKEMQKRGTLVCMGRGRDAKWRKSI